MTAKSYRASKGVNGQRGKVQSSNAGKKGKIHQKRQSQ